MLLLSKTCRTWSLKNVQRQADYFNFFQKRSMTSTVSKTITRRASGHGSIPPFAFLFFTSRMRSSGRSMRTSPSSIHYPSTTWVMMPKFITSSSTPEFFILQARLWLPLEGPSLGQLGPHGSWGLSPVGETACTLRGDRWTTSREKGKRTAGTPDGACGQPERELPAWPLRGF